MKVLAVLVSLALLISLSTFLAPPLASANTTQTWHVATTGNNTSGDGTAGNPWLTIQHAIGQASSGDTIIVHPGEYSAGNQVDKSNLAIQSSGGAEVTTVHGSAVDGFVVNVSSVVIDGFTITNCYRGIYLQRISESNYARNCVIRNNIIENNNYGILADHSTWGNEIINNTIENNGHGIWMEGDNNEIVGNNILNNPLADSGIHLTGPDAINNYIRLNNIVGNPPEWGVYSNETTVYADINWWGDVSGPSGSGSGSGDSVNEYVDYYRWLGAPLQLPAAHSEYPIGIGTHVVDAMNEADTRVTFNITDEYTYSHVIIAKYQSQPFPDEPFNDTYTALGKYIEIFFYSSPPVWPIYVEMRYTDDEVAAAGIDESSLGLFHYQPGNTFYRCLDTGVDTSTNIIRANVTQLEVSLRTFGAGGSQPTQSLADLAISKSASPDPVALGGLLEYTLTVTNNGPSDATGVVVTDNLPSADISSVTLGTPSQGSASESAGVVTWNVGDLAITSSATLTITVTVKSSAGGSITNTATVSGTKIDLNPENDASIVETVTTSSTTSIPSVPGISLWGGIAMAVLFFAMLIWLMRRRLIQRGGKQ